MIPRDIKQQIDNYIDNGIPPADFLYAVLINDLRQVAGRADIINRIHLYDIIVYLEKFMPNMAWGSAERVEKWLAFHRDNPVFIAAAIEYDKARRETYYETYMD